MTYEEAKEILRDGSGLTTGESLENRLKESPGVLSEIDSQVPGGDLPEIKAYADKILVALLVVRNELVGKTTMERDLAGILVELIQPIRKLASNTNFEKTRITQLSMILDWIFHMGEAHNK